MRPTVRANGWDAQAGAGTVRRAGRLAEDLQILSVSKRSRRRPWDRFAGAGSPVSQRGTVAGSAPIDRASCFWLSPRFVRCSAILPPGVAPPVRAVAEEVHDGRVVSDGRSAIILLPISRCESRDGRFWCNVPLIESELQSAALQMVPAGLAIGEFSITD